jgi:hypothetical protein
MASPGLKVIENSSDNIGISDTGDDVRGRTKVTGVRMPGVMDSDCTAAMFTDVDINAEHPLEAGHTKTTAHTGAVTLIQRFGSALDLNVHLHMLYLDGVYWDGLLFATRLIR